MRPRTWNGWNGLAAYVGASLLLALAAAGIAAPVIVHNYDVARGLLELQRRYGSDGIQTVILDAWYPGMSGAVELLRARAPQPIHLVAFEDARGTSSRLQEWLYPIRPAVLDESRVRRGDLVVVDIERKLGVPADELYRGTSVKVLEVR